MRHRNLCTTEEENNNKTKSQESSHGSEDPDGGCEVPPALSSQDQGVLAQHRTLCPQGTAPFVSHSHPTALQSHLPWQNQQVPPAPEPQHQKPKQPLIQQANQRGEKKALP